MPAVMGGAHTCEQEKTSSITMAMNEGNPEEE
jgi:hypothetical protein